MTVETFPGLECLMRKAECFPRRHKAAQTLSQACLTEQHRAAGFEPNTA